MVRAAETIQESIVDRIKLWPTQPGIYIMRDCAKRILYVGKAKSLRSRIRSYFLEAEKLTPKTRVLMKKVSDVEFTVTNTELEALLLECNLIKKHRPRYNIRLKDDKNFPYVVLDFTHPFPQFRITRKIITAPNLRYFGPFSGGVNEIGRFLLKTFQIRDCSDAKFRNRTRPCLNYEIGTCTAPCVNYVTQEAYNEQIHQAILFLKGKKRELVAKLKTEMNEAAEKLEYERAKTIRDKISSIEMITEKQNAVLTDKQKDIDVIGVYPANDELQIVVLFIRAGFLTGRRTDRVPLVLDNVEGTVRSYLEQFYLMALCPDEIWMASDFEDRDLLERSLTERCKKTVRILIRRSEKPMRLLGMAYENAKLLYQESQQKEKPKGSASEELAKVLDLSEPPQTIEGIDVSNIQGTNPAVALVHFADERPFKNRYRRYHPKTVEGQNDFAMIYEVVLRRFSDEENPPPDLLLIDGGKGQLQSALKALDELEVSIPVCSLAKARTESGFTLKEVSRSEERIFVPNRKNPIILKEGHPALRLLQRVRDEAHRFSVKSHQNRRKKDTLEKSALTEIRGIGQKTRERLLKHFGSLDAIRASSLEDLIKAGITRPQAEAVLSSRAAAEELREGSEE
jgi:excinuclease ABC subunit C